MNSRVAYDEEEVLRRVLEESSRETGTLGKRTRDDSDEYVGNAFDSSIADLGSQKQNLKRQRTSSSSPSTVSKHSQSPEPATDDLTKTTSNGTKSTQKLRGAAARNNKEKELRDKQKEQVAAQKLEAATKRAARSERRRGEGTSIASRLCAYLTSLSDSPPPTPSISPSKAVEKIAAGQKAKADTPPSGRGGAHNRKTGRPPARRGRLGRNQYTRDLPINGDASDTPMRETSHDRNNAAGSPSGHGINGESGRSSKAKTHPARTSMNEMKRRVAALLEFVGRMHTERGPQSQGQSSASASASSLGTTTPNGLSTTTLPTASLVKAIEVGLEKASNSHNGRVQIKDEREFAGMNSVEMMETLTQQLVQWQSVYGTYAR